MTLTSGIPSIQAYKALLNSKLYKDLEIESDHFLKQHHDDLAAFRKTWVKDPVRQWSRSWEYPYMWERLIAKQKAGAKILDAGSGLTFFPFALAKKLNCQVDCLDYDLRLTEPFKKIAAKEQTAVRFLDGEMRDLPYDDNTFDAIYCVSVLEHTNRYQEIVDEFKRVLKPGGDLLVSFDICKSGVADIGIEETYKLLNVLRSWASTDANLEEPVKDYIQHPDKYLTTLHARSERPESLPWMFPLLSAIKAGIRHGKIKSFIDLTCYCFEGQKR